MVTVLEYYLYSFGFPVTVATDHSDPFHKAAAINRKVESLSCDYLILNDADSLVPWAQIDAALECVKNAPGLVYAFDTYRRLSRTTTAALRSYHDAFTAAWEWEQSPSDSHGCIVIRREDFLQAGGYDERFVGWGREDHEFGERCERLWPGRRVAGPLIHLWHPPAEPNPDNAKLYLDIREGRA